MYELKLDYNEQRMNLGNSYFRVTSKIINISLTI